MTDTGPPLPPGRPVDLPGRGTTFVRELDGPGGAPTLLLLHGWTATADLNWFTSYHALAERYRVVAVDHRGHGRGIRSRDAFRLEDCADDAAAVVRRLETGPVVAVGYSMGGPIAKLLWHRHPELVSGLVLCATSDSFGVRPEERVWFKGVEGLARCARVAPRNLVGRLGERIMTARIGDGPHAAWARAELALASHRMLLEAGAALGHFHSRPWLGRINVPTSVIVTGRDRVVPPARQEHMAAAIPGAAVHHIPCDHSACISEPERFLPALLRACHTVTDRARHLLPA